MKKTVILHTLLALCASLSFAQTTSNITQALSINGDGAAPDASALFEVKSTEQGMLVPRMTTAQRTAIVSPALSLLVFDIDSGSFWFHNGTAWAEVGRTYTAGSGISIAGSTISNAGDTNPGDDLTTASTAGGDLTGTFSNLQIASSAVGSAEIADGAVGSAEITDGTIIAADLGQMGATSGQVLKWNGSAWTTGSVSVLQDADADTKIQVEETLDEDLIRFDLGGTERFVMTGSRLEPKNTGGSVFIGNGTGASDDLSDHKNAAVGDSSLFSNITGEHNTAFGTAALYSNTAGNYNTAIGSDALRSNTTGSANIANGWSALFSNTEGNTNMANGDGALYNNLDGSFNVASGHGSLDGNVSGSSNTASGDGAGDEGDNNNCTAIGADTDTGTSEDNYTNATAIGYDANTTADDYVRIGNTSVMSIGGQVAWSTYSDGRFKRSVQEDVAGLDFITRLRPVTYQWDIHALNDFIPTADEGSKQWASKYAIEQLRFTGFIAQEVAQAARESGFDFSGVDMPKNETTPYALRYSEFVVPLVKSVQEQQAIIENGELRMESLEAENAVLKKQVEAQAALLQKISTALVNAGISVEK